MPNVSIRTLREKLKNFHDIELDEFCQVNYYQVYNNFARGMRKDEKIIVLIDYCIRKNIINELASLIENASKYDDKPLSQQETPQIIKLHLQTLESKIRVRGFFVPRGGVPYHDATVPYSPKQLKAILKALEIGEYIPSRFRPEYSVDLVDLGFLYGDHLNLDIYKVVGKQLFNILFQGEILAELRIAQQKGNVICQILFDPDDVFLFQYPWELIHDGNSFLVPIKAGIEIIRSISASAPSSHISTLQFDVLYISPRPVDDNLLPNETEKWSIISGTNSHVENKLANIIPVEPPTWLKLTSILAVNKFPVFHFDGHGSYAKVCSKCNLPHYPSQIKCLNCGELLDSATGYLHFENEQHFIDKVKVDDVKVMLANTNIQVVILSACDSSTSRNETIFAGVAPALLQIGIPIIVALQGSPTADAMNLFFEKFYSALADGKRISEAANLGRLAVFHIKPSMWFMPTVFSQTVDEVLLLSFRP